MQIFLSLSAAHYPERLGTFFIVSPPAVFSTLWRAISHFIDPVTKQKVGGAAWMGERWGPARGRVQAAQSRLLPPAMIPTRSTTHPT